jgi:hypothetical protein
MSAPVAGTEAGKSGMDAGRRASESVSGLTGGGKSGFPILLKVRAALFR